MEAIAYYLFRSSVWLTGFGLVYLLFLRNERFFLLNRIYLITGMLVSLIFPLFTWHYTVVLPVTPSLEVFQPQMTGVPVVDVESSYSFSYQDGLWIAYIIGVSIMIFKVVSQLLSVRKVIVQSGVKSFDTVRLVRSDRYPASFSFFSFVFVNPSVTDIEMGEIINHEQEHIMQRHWIDLLILEAVTLVQWFNPVVWLYGRMIRQNHEYLADEGALQRSQNPATYRAALLNQMFGGSVISLSNSFNYSINKKRFYMMKKTISSPIRKLKLLLVFPLIAGVFYAFSAPKYQFVQVENESVKVESAPESSEVIAAQLNAFMAQTSGKEANQVQSQPNNNVSTALQADNTIIKGKVVDEAGNSLTRAAVVEVDNDGRNISATLTDQSGNFVLKAKEGATLNVVLSGYQSQKITPESGKEIRVILKKDANSSGELKESSDAISTFIRGKVVDEAGNPLDMAGVRIYDKTGRYNGGMVTNQSGSFGIVVQEGTTLNVALPGYQSQKVNPEVGKVTLVVLKKEASSADDQKSLSDIKIIKGQVVDENGDPLANTNIAAVNTAGRFTAATMSDQSGNFMLKVVDDNPLVISFIGYFTQKINPDFEKEMKIVLKASKINLSEVSISPDSNESSIKNSSNQVVTANGTLGTSIRNLNDPNSKPLLVVDGKIAENQDANAINPENIQSISVLKGETATTLYGDKAKDGAIVISLKKAAATSSDEKVPFMVEEMPQFPGGSEALLNFMNASLKYPQVAKENGIQGKVIVSFVVSKTGDVKNAKIARSVDPSLDEEALRIVNSLPKWTPGKQGGKAVDVAYTVPVNFVLPSNIKVVGYPVNNSATGSTIQIRNWSNPDSKPLIVVDGKIVKINQTSFDYANSDVENFGKLIGVAPENIIAIEVLKDQNSIAVYGEKGKNGVLRITTKSAGQKTEEKTQVKVTTMKKLIIVPNPASNQVTVTAEDMKVPTKLDVSIYDPFGKLIKKEKKNGPTFILTVSDLTSGTYLVVANDGSQPYSGSLVVIH